MRSFLLFFLLAPLAIEATPSTSVSCTMAGQTQTQSDPASSACMVSVDAFDYTSAFAKASESIGMQSALNVSAGLMAIGTAPPNLSFDVSAQASDALTFDTNGPSRTGLVAFDIEISNEHAGVGDAVISDGVHRYSLESFPGGCQLRFCSDTGTLPFDLGSMFQVNVSASDSAVGDTAFDGRTFGDAGVTFTFSLLEANGTTPVSFFAVPEPNTSGFLVCGLAGLAWLFSGGPFFGETSFDHGREGESSGAGGTGKDTATRRHVRRL